LGVVRVRLDHRFDEERARFALRFACEDCAHHEARTGRCRHEWPAEDHLAAAVKIGAAEIVFCKEFELC
jgi:hypothetical protein